jgi:DNA-binding transcriptional ArsR family regulator
MEIIENCRKMEGLFKNSVEQPVISSHLKVLLKANFVDKFPYGKQRIYHIDQPNVEYFDFLSSLWASKDNEGQDSKMVPLSISL